MNYDGILRLHALSLESPDKEVNGVYIRIRIDSFEIELTNQFLYLVFRLEDILRVLDDDEAVGVEQSGEHFDQSLFSALPEPADFVDHLIVICALDELNGKASLQQIHEFHCFGNSELVDAFTSD